MKRSLLIHPEELSLRWIDRACALGLDTLALHPRGGKNAWRTLEEMLVMLDSPAYRAMLDTAAERGLTIEYECHAASFLLPRALFDEAPSLFRVGEDGNRCRELNFCTSSEEALDLVAENAVRLAKRLYRSNHTYYFWMDDVKNGTCFCPDCQALSESDRQLIVMNRIVRALRREIPDAKLAYLAYFGTLEPPKAVRPEEGIFLEYAPFERDRAASPFADAETEQKVDALLRFFGKKDAKALEYWFDNSMFSNWQKPPKPFSPDNEKIRAELAEYAEKGFETLSSFACFFGDDYEALYGAPDLSVFRNA